jgi:HlyD family secretion protein
VAQLETQLRQAEIALQRAQNNLEKATLRAPFDGLVAAVHVGEGELASGVAVELLDPASMQVVLDVDEIDIGDLEVGQEATVTLQPWPDEEIQSEVLSIAPAANNLVLSSAIASFRVRLALPPNDLPIREGMTADASLQTARREDVLLAPNRAVTIDRETGRYFVSLVETDADGEQTTRQVEVTIGLRDDRFTEITSGLAEGDRVRIEPVVQPVDLFQPGGPNGGPPEGGPFGGGS